MCSFLTIFGVFLFLMKAMTSTRMNKTQVVCSVFVGFLLFSPHSPNILELFTYAHNLD